MGKAAGGSSGRRAGAARGAWLACMGAAVAAPAFGQQTAAQLDDLTRTMTQYSQPKANAQARATTATATASASGPDKHSGRSVAPPVREKPAQSGHKSAAAAAKPASPPRDAATTRQVPAAAVRATPAPSTPKVATTTRSQPQSTPPALPARTPVVAVSAAPVATPTVAPASKASGTAGAVVGQEDSRFWMRPWSWVAGAAVLVLLLVEGVGWRRHHLRKRDAKVLANIVPTVRPGDREADYHPRPSQPPDHPRQFGAG